MKNGRINLKEALNIIAKLATTHDGEFQHLLAGIYSVFAKERRVGFAIAIIAIFKAGKMNL